MAAHIWIIHILFVIVTITVVPSSADNPHIILIVADDLGFTDVSFHGSPQIPTPNLDTLAYDGIILNNYYVQPICSPTRSALLTARYPIHTGLQHGVIGSSCPYGLSLNETLLSQYLKKEGYNTHIVGKWHLGFFAKEYTPLYRGFDTHLGYLLGKEDYWDHTSNEGSAKKAWGLDFRDQMEVGREYFGRYSTELYTERAQKIIMEHDKAKPMFLYLPFQSVHSANPYQPLQFPWRFYEKMSHIKDTHRRKFAAMVSALDEAVGNITETLHEQGMLNNSIIVFTTDNGGPAGGFDWNYASNYPLRGMKHLLWEGGTRGAAFLWSPLLKQSGYISNHMMHVTDWMPTLLHVAGGNLTKLEKNKLDGMNVWDALSNKDVKSPRTEFLYNIDPEEPSHAVRVGDMKLIFGKPEAGRNGGWIKPKEVIEVNMTKGNNGKYRGVGNNVDEVVNLNPGKDDPIPAHLLRSEKLEKILIGLGRKEVTSHPAVVNCGEKPENASLNCQVDQSPCLYNITADPCEYHNLADSMPDTVIYLMKRLIQYQDSMVAPRNKPRDPAGLPINRNGVWGPWINLTDIKDKTEL